MINLANLHVGFGVNGRLPGSLGECAGQKRGHALGWISGFVDLFHLSSTLHAPLKPEISRLYVNQVADNPDFMFTASLGHRFTYDRDVDAGAATYWKQGLFPLLRARRLAAVTMQFPWSFRFTAENREFLIRLRRTFHEFPLAVEFRHESWLAEEAISTLIDYHLSLINIDQPVYFRAMPPTAALTAGVAVVMLHGRSSPAVFNSFDRGASPEPYRYTTGELESWLPRLRRLAENATRTLVIFDNRSGSNAMVNALQTAEMLEASRLKAPAELIRQFPGELGSFRASKPVQPLLIPRYVPDSAVA